MSFCTDAKLILNHSHRHTNQVFDLLFLTFCQWEKRWLTGHEFLQIWEITFLQVQKLHSRPSATQSYVSSAEIFQPVDPRRSRLSIRVQPENGWSCWQSWQSCHSIKKCGQSEKYPTDRTCPPFPIQNTLLTIHIGKIYFTKIHPVPLIFDISQFPKVKN